jgi:sec-independent protein translocase protein TatA
MFGGGVGWPELVIVLVIVLVIFGAKRLPEVGRSLGSGMREFKDSITGKGDKDADEVVTPPQVTAGDQADRVERT